MVYLVRVSRLWCNAAIVCLRRFAAPALAAPALMQCGFPRSVYIVVQHLCVPFSATQY
jgi:hypothetical protein